MKDINIRCSCGCGEAFQVTFRVDDEENYAIISTITAGFYAHQTGIWSRMKRRIQAAWYMLIGKEYCLHEVVLTKEQWDDFVTDINRTDIEFK
jgi:hypothetical protein